MNIMNPNSPSGRLIGNYPVNKRGIVNKNESHGTYGDQVGRNEPRGVFALNLLPSSPGRASRAGYTVHGGAGLHMGRIRADGPGLSLFLSPWGFSTFGFLGCFMFNFSNLSRDEVRYA